MVEDNSAHAPIDEPRTDAADPPNLVSRDARSGVAVEMAVNSLVGLPFFAAGVFAMIDDGLSSQAPGWAPWAIILVGAAMVMVGFYVSVLARPRLNLIPGEKVLELRHPSMKPAFARIAVSVPFFAVAGYMLWFTLLPYVYPFAPFVVGMYLYLRGVIQYWINHHTAYYATNRRAVRMYRFVWLDTTEIPIGSVNSISVTRSFIEMLTGRGSVQVASGIGARHKVHIKEIDNPEPIAQTIREMAQ